MEQARLRKSNASVVLPCLSGSRQRRAGKTGPAFSPSQHNLSQLFLLHSLSRHARFEVNCFLSQVSSPASISRIFLCHNLLLFFSFIFCCQTQCFTPKSRSLRLFPLFKAAREGTRFLHTQVALFPLAHTQVHIILHEEESNLEATAIKTRFRKS